MNAIWRKTWILAGVLGVAFLVPALFAPWLAPFDPYAGDLALALSSPELAHPMGRDEQGMDILSRLLHGARISLVVGLSTVAVSALVGVALGMVAGYAGGWVEQVLMRLVDVLLAFPGLLLAIALVAVMGPGLLNVIFALAALGWTGFARLARAQVLAIKTMDYVQAAVALGAGNTRTLLRHILPNILGPILVIATLGVGAAILTEAALSFLGLGAQPPTPSWGGMLSNAREQFFTAPWIAVFPGLAIFITVLGFNLLGDGLRDILDPHTIWK